MPKLAGFAFGIVAAAGSAALSGCGSPIGAPSTLAITTAALPAATAGSSYTAAITASGGVAPYAFSMSGPGPSGLSLSAAGVLAGTPAASGTVLLVVQVSDAAGEQFSKRFSLVISSAPVPLSFSLGAPPAGIVGSAYSYAVGASGGTAPYTFGVSSGSLPAGLSLSSSGVLSGTPTAAGTSSFAITVTDSSGATLSQSFIIAVTDAAVTVDTTATLATVPANFYGMHTSVYDTNLTDTSAIVSMLANAGITTLRFPGGGYSDNYHWAQNSMTPFFATSTGACGVVDDGNAVLNSHFGTFAKLLQAAGANGLITVNYGNSVADAAATLTYGTDGQKSCSEPNTAGQPQEAAAWVAYANGDPASPQVIGTDAVGFDWKTVGFWASLRAASPLATDDGCNFLRIGHAASLGISHWEIGNEIYYNGWATNHNAESDNHAPYIYPGGYSGGTFDSRDSVAALSPSAYGTNAVQFIQAMKAVDPTIKIGVDFSSPIATDPIPTTWNPELAQAVCAGATLDFAIMHYYPGTWKAVQPGELLSLPQQDLPSVTAGIRANLQQYCPANASSIEIWLTETSPNNGLAPNFPQPVIGLFTLNDYLSALTSGIRNMDWLQLHDGSFLTENEVPGPSYYGTLLAHQLAATGDAMVKSTSSTGAVVSYASLKANGQKGVLLINANPTSTLSVKVTVNGATLGATATEYSYGVNAAQSGTSITSSSVSVNGNSVTVSVPAFTAVELLIP